MLGQETRDLGAMIVQQGYKSSFMILYGHSRLDRPNEILLGLCAILSNVEEVIRQRKKIGGSSGRMISILYYFMLQKQCHWTCVIRILELVIGVRFTHMSSVSLRMIVLEGCRFEFIWVQKYNFSILEGLVSLSQYCFKCGVQNPDPLAFYRHD